MSNEVSKRFSTTQVAGTLTVAFTLYNAFARNTGKPMLDMSADEMLALAALVAPAATAAYMMWRRTKKSHLFFGMFK